MSTDLKIRVISNLKESQNIMLYQENISLSVKNFLVGAWRKVCIAPGAKFDVVLPLDIEVQGRQSIESGSMQTKAVRVDYNTAWTIFDNEGAMDMEYCTNPNPTDNTIDVYNACQDKRVAVALKNGKPIFACYVRPNGKVNFAIHPKLFLALSDYYIKEDFFEAAALSQKFEYDYEGQNSITITLTENQETGLISASANYGPIENFAG